MKRMHHLKRVRLAMESLRNVLRANQGKICLIPPPPPPSLRLGLCRSSLCSGVELLCKGHFRLLFALLKYGDDKDMQMLTLEVRKGGNGTGFTILQGGAVRKRG